MALLRGVPYSTSRDFFLLLQAGFGASVALTCWALRVPLQWRYIRAILISSTLGSAVSTLYLKGIIDTSLSTLVIAAAIGSGCVMGISTHKLGAVLSGRSYQVPEAAGAPVDMFVEQKDAWEADGRWLYKHEVYVVNKGAHNITRLDVAIPAEGVTWQTWGCHDRGDGEGWRTFQLPESVLGNGGIRAGETYNFGGVFSQEKPDFRLVVWEAPS